MSLIGRTTPQEHFPLEMIRCLLKTLEAAEFPLDSFDSFSLPNVVFENTPISPSESLPVADAARIFWQGKVLMNDESFGFEQRQSRPLGQLKLLFLSCLSCSHFGDMLRKMEELTRYLQRDSEFPLNYQGIFAVAGFERQYFDPALPCDCLQAYDVVQLFWWYRSYSWFIGELVELEAVHVMGPDYGIGAYVEALFNCSVVFDQPAYQICFSRRYLQFPVVRNAEDIDAFFEDPGAAYLNIKDPQSESYSVRVRRLLDNTPAKVSLSLEEAARQMFCSRHTLIRRLRCEDSSFQAIKDQWRTEQATELLAQPQLAIAQISDHLGFANTPAFTRAFKNWTGMSPSNYREQLD